MNSTTLSISIIVLTALTFAMTSAVAVAATPPKFRYRQLKADLQIKYLITEANYDSQGNIVSLLPDHSYDYFSVRPKLLYAISNNIAIEGGFTYASATSENGIDQRKNARVSDVEASVYYKAIKKKSYLLPHLKVSFPLVKFENDSDEVIVNEGVLQVQVGTFLETIFLNHRFYGYAGYLFRGENRAHLFPYTLGVYNSIGRFTYGLAVGGNFVGSDDSFVQSPTLRTDVTDTLNGGSQYFFAVNPEKIEASGMLGVRITSGTQVLLKLAQTITGKNTAETQTAFFQIKARLLNPIKKRRKRQKGRFRIEGLDDKDLKALDELSDQIP